MHLHLEWNVFYYYLSASMGANANWNCIKSLPLSCQCHLSGKINNFIHFPCFIPALNHILVSYFWKYIKLVQRNMRFMQTLKCNWSNVLWQTKVLGAYMMELASLLTEDVLLRWAEKQTSVVCNNSKMTIYKYHRLVISV